MKYTSIFLTIFFATIPFSNSSAARHSPDVDDLIGLYEFLDKYKPASCNHKIVRHDSDGSSLICIYCHQSLLDGTGHHIIGRFGRDLHVHVMHERCFDLVKNNPDPCPFCEQIAAGARRSTALDQNLFSLIIDVLLTMQTKGSRINFANLGNTHIKLDLSCIQPQE